MVRDQSAGMSDIFQPGHRAGLRERVEFDRNRHWTSVAQDRPKSDICWLLGEFAAQLQELQIHRTRRAANGAWET